MLSCSKEIKDILLRLRWYFVDTIKPALQGQRDLYNSRKGSPILKWTIFPRFFLIFNELKKNFMKHQIYLRPFERETSPLRLASLHPPLLALREYDVTVSDKCDRLAYLAGRGWVSGALYSFSNDERNNRFTLCCWNNVLCRLSVLKPSKSHLMGLAGQKFKIAARMVWLHPLSLGL